MGLPLKAGKLKACRANAIGHRSIRSLVFLRPFVHVLNKPVGQGKSHGSSCEEHDAINERHISESRWQIRKLQFLHQFAHLDTFGFPVEQPDNGRTVVDLDGFQLPHPLPQKICRTEQTLRQCQLAEQAFNPGLVDFQTSERMSRRRSSSEPYGSQ